MRNEIKLLPVLGVLLILGTGCACRKWVVEEPALKTMEVVTPESVYPMVKSIADEWQPDAIVAHVVAVFPGHDLEGGPDRISYEFVTELQGDRQGSAWLDVYPWEGKIHVEACAPAYTEDPAWLPAFETALVSSTQALQAAEAAGGTSYREAHADVTVFVSALPTIGHTVWEVRYVESAPGPGGLSIWIDTQTGEVFSPS